MIWWAQEDKQARLEIQRDRLNILNTGSSDEVTSRTRTTRYDPARPSRQEPRLARPSTPQNPALTQRGFVLARLVNAGEARMFHERAGR